MGKDRAGNSNPGKGSPSGTSRNEESRLRSATSPEDIEQDERLSEKYNMNEDEPGGEVRVRHRNRNSEKRESNGSQGSRTSRTDFVADDQEVVKAEELPGVLNREVFAELAAYQADCCVSFYIQTQAAGVEVNEQKDLIKFKNHLQALKKTLSEKGKDEATIQKMLEPGFDLLGDEGFWKKLTPGLAVFLAEGFFKYTKMPLAPIEEILFDKTFYITPLIPVMTSREYFYLLVISKKQAKLFRADSFGMQFIDVPGVPNGVDDVVRIDERDDEQLFRQGSRGANGGANFHGHGTGAADEKTQIATYLEEVDDTIWKEVLHDENVPLLLAGVEYLIPIYKKVTDYNNIWDDALTGSYEHVDTANIHQQAMEKMQPYFQQRTKKALELYGNQSATQLTSSVDGDIIPAAYYGRIAHLFVEKGAHVWGSFDEANNELQIRESQGDGDECLVDHAVEKTILNGGEVYILEREEMPAQSIMAAVMRY